MNQKRILCEKLPFSGSPSPISESEAHHATTVLRLREGDLVTAMDGKGSAVASKFLLKGGVPRLEIVEGAQIERSHSGDVVPLTLEMSVLKGDAMEWVIEKAVELGVQAIIPVLTERVVVQMDRKGPEQFLDRWRRVAMQSLKQCERLDQIEIKMPISILELARDGNRRIFGDERSQSPGLGEIPMPEGDSLRFLVGPEGGWSPHERQALIHGGALSASLGPFVLRAETAAIAGVSVLVSRLRRSIIGA